MKKSGIVILSVLLIALMAAGIGTTAAYLSDKTQTVVNVFHPGAVPPEITEDFNGIVKENVRVKNQGNVACFLRAVVIVSWKDEEGNLASKVPVNGVDYTLDLSGEGWKNQGGYHYCLTPVAPGAESPVLIRKAEQLSYPEGYTLVVEILAQTIQAEGRDSDGKKPIEKAWGVDIQNGTIIIPGGEDAL